MSGQRPQTNVYRYVVTVTFLGLPSKKPVVYEVKSSNRIKMLDVYIDILHIDIRHHDKRYTFLPP